jgi:amino acid transporter
MFSLQQLKDFVLGKPRDPLSRDTRHSVTLIAFLAWIGLGADGLSSSNYGPELAFLALGEHTSLAIYLGLATAFTVFVISIAYTQVIELFPNGGGGYQIASTLLGKRAGLLSGSALIIDYVLTIAISVASGMDALMSVLPQGLSQFSLYLSLLVVVLLVFLNLRGMKESIKILMPIFLGFVFTHVGLILAGIFTHAEGLTHLLSNAVADTNATADSAGLFFVIAILLKAFSMGGGTYTGLEAVSNNVNTLAEPKVKTGKLTMFFVAVSLAFMATGIIIIYLLWDVRPVAGQTLNATVFYKITEHWQVGGIALSSIIVPISLLFATGLLFVAANTGFLAGPTVLANMATDKWMPHSFASLSSRLVTKNGVVIMGGAAIAALVFTGGQVDILVVLYSINVFITFTLSMLGLCRYWIINRASKPQWLRKLSVALVGFVVCCSILIVTIIEKFATGGWLTMLVTSLVFLLGWKIRNHYIETTRKLREADDLLTQQGVIKVDEPPHLQHDKPTAVLLVNEHIGNGMHTLLWIMRLFPKAFTNFVFISVAEVDSASFGEDTVWQQRRRDVKKSLKYYVNYCNQHNHAATFYLDYCTDVVGKLTDVAEKVIDDFPNCVFFGSKLIFDNESIFKQMLHNQTAYMIQRRLHTMNKPMIILPIRV